MTPASSQRFGQGSARCSCLTVVGLNREAAIEQHTSAAHEAVTNVYRLAGMALFFLQAAELPESLREPNRLAVLNTIDPRKDLPDAATDEASDLPCCACEDASVSRFFRLMPTPVDPGPKSKRARSDTLFDFARISPCTLADVRSPHLVRVGD